MTWNTWTLSQPFEQRCSQIGLLRVIHFAVALMCACAFSSSALAGEILYLKTGSIDTAKLSDPYAELRKLPKGGQEKALHFVVQFKSHVRAEDRQNLSTLGAAILRYLPDDALIIEASARVARTIALSSTAVRVVLPYRDDWKLSPEFEPGSVFTGDNSVQVLVRAFPGADGAQLVNQVSAAGARVDVASGRNIVATVKLGKLARLSAIEGVEWIQPNPEFKTMNFDDDGFDGQAQASATGDYSDLSGYESGTRLMNFDAAWKRGFTGKGQVVAMADTGLDRGDTTNIHGDFTGRVPQGLIFGLFSKSWEDPMGHGTHVAGSVLGSGALAGGLLKGGAYEATLIPESMWSPMLNNLSVPSKLRDLFAKSYDLGARVHTNSWGTPRNPGAYDAFSQEVDEFIASNPDMLVIFAAGNSGVDADKDGRIDPGSIGSPGTAKNVLTVGASKNYVLKGGIQKKLKETKTGQESWGAEPLASSMLSENPKGLAPFSSRGPTLDGRMKPEIVAPGTNILSTRSKNPSAEPLWGEYNSEYVWSGGTSMSTPLTAGAAAVARQYLIDSRKIASPSAALVKGVLIHSAKDLFPGQFGDGGKAAGQELLSTRPNFDEGYGLVDMDRATNLAKALIIDERSGVGAGEKHSYPVHVSGRSKLVATLVYTDSAAAASASKSLVNDLDLVVTDSSGKETSIGDHVNNSEMIELQVPAGDYEIQVKGTNVPQGPASGKQPYALILSVD